MSQFDFIAAERPGKEPFPVPPFAVEAVGATVVVDGRDGHLCSGLDLSHDGSRNNGSVNGDFRHVG